MFNCWNRVACTRIFAWHNKTIMRTRTLHAFKQDSKKRRIHVCRKLDNSIEGVFCFFLQGIVSLDILSKFLALNELMRTRRILNRDKTHDFKYLSTFCFHCIYQLAGVTHITKARVFVRENPFFIHSRGKNSCAHSWWITITGPECNLGSFVDAWQNWTVFLYSGQNSPSCTPP